MKTISLTRDKVALVDDIDFDFLNQFNWYAWEEPKAKNLYYAVRNISTDTGRTTLRMHNVLLTPIRGYDVDHIDGNGLNNQRSNLRYLTHALNNTNCRTVEGKSAYKGVTRYRNGWQARISANGVRSHLGCFESEKDAAKAYDRAALELFNGQFARLNFPEEVKL